MNNKFERHFRILKQSEFQELSARGKRRRFNSVRSTYSFEKNQNSQLGLAVSTKVGSSVKRNLIRRLIKEWFRCSELKRSGIKLVISVDSTIFSAINAKLDIGQIVRRDLQLLENWLTKYNECNI